MGSWAKPQPTSVLGHYESERKHLEAELCTNRFLKPIVICENFYSVSDAECLSPELAATQNMNTEHDNLKSQS